jgi:phosphohistidine phosphatase SixA
VVRFKLQATHNEEPIMPMSILCRLATAAIIIACAAGGSQAQALRGSALVAALRQGGYVLLMRHAHSPEMRPDKAAADPENTNLERQLDQVGRDTALAMGEAIKKLGIPIADVLSSPTYRALETVRLASLGRAQAFPELGDGGQSMQRISEAPAEWLRQKAGEPPRSGTDTVIVTHMPNLVAAFGQAANGAADGETFVFHPDGKGGAELIARVKIEEWPALASQQ